MTSLTRPANNPPTQIIYLTIPASKPLTNTTWSTAIDVLSQTSGFIRAYWGRSLETPEKVQLHIVREILAQHKNFLYSHSYDQFLTLISPLTQSSTTKPLVRHAHLHPFTSSPLSHPFPPFVGSAIYISTTPTWHEGAWPLWTHIVRYVKGCNGIAGGELEEDVDGFGSCYLVYVGWNSVEEHEGYHHTKHFENRRVVLGLGNGGFREYGHVVFEGAREKGGKRKGDGAKL